MNDSNSNDESSQSDDSSMFSDEIIPVSHQIQQFENKFEDINDFWDNTNTTPKHVSVSIANTINSPHLIAPMKSSVSQFSSYRPIPPRSFRNSVDNAINNSPIYVGTSTEETPRRLDSSDYTDSQKDDSSDSSDDITFVDTPITDKSKPESPSFNRSNDVFKLSPIISNKNESKSKIYNKESSYSDFTSSESEIANTNNQINHSIADSIIDDKNENQEFINESIVNSKNSNSNFPMPTFSIPDSSDSDKDQQNPEEIVHSKIIKDKNLNVNSIKKEKDDNRKSRATSKPAFASPKRSSNGMKKETIITELSPLASSRRKNVEDKKEMTVFRLSQIDQEEEEKVENCKQQDNLNENDNEKETDKVKKSQSKSPSYKQVKSKAKSPLQNQIHVQSNDTSETGLKSLIENNNNEDIIDSNTPKSKIRSKTNLKIKNNIENESKQQKYNTSPALTSRSRAKIEEANEKSPKLQKHDVNSASKSRSKSEIENKNEIKLQKTKSKSNSKSKSSSQSSPSKLKPESSSQPSPSKSKSNVSPKSKSSSKAKSSPKTSPKSNSQSSKSKTKTRYDFSCISDDEDDDNRISNLIQIPDSPTNNNKNNDLQSNEDDSDLPIALRRRKRVIVKPLKFWCGEHIVYGLSEDGFQTFQNVAIPKKLRKLKKGEIRVTMKEQKNLPVKEDRVRKLIGVEGKGMAIFQDKVVDFDDSNEVFLDKGVRCIVVTKGELPFIFRIDEI